MGNKLGKASKSKEVINSESSINHEAIDTSLSKINEIDA